MKKSFLCFFIVNILVLSSTFGFEPISTEELLLSYLQNDSQLQELTLAAQKAELNLQQTNISNGFDINLTTGTITIRTVENSTVISAKPSINVSLPAASNLSINAKSEFTNSNSSSISPTDTSLSVNADIISNNLTSRTIALKKAERSLLEAKRKLEKRAISAEKEFYSNLKSLLNSTNSIIQSENSLYTDKIDFQKTIAQGFSKESSTYRLSEMKVLSDEHNIETAKHALVHSYVVFYMNCGYPVEFDINQDFTDLIPTDIPVIEAIDILSFDKESFTEIENAKWTYEINSLERNNHKNFSLSANAGYTFDNSVTKTDSVDAGVSGTFGGVTIGAGVNIPVGNETISKNPVYNFSAAISPNTFRKNAITERTNQLTEEQELLTIQSAYTDYETAIVEALGELEEITWEKQTNEENYEMYAKLSEDLSEWYSQGFITQSEYLSAKTKMQQYNVKKIINQIDLIIYNNNVREKFYN